MEVPVVVEVEVALESQEADGTKRGQFGDVRREGMPVLQICDCIRATPCYPRGSNNNCPVAFLPPKPSLCALPSHTFCPLNHVSFTLPVILFPS